MGHFYNLYTTMHFRLRPGMEKEFTKFIEDEFPKKAHDDGCLTYTTLRHNKDENHWVWSGSWSRMEDAHKFENHWNAKRKEFAHWCLDFPKFDYYKSHDSYSRRERKSA